MCGGLDQTVVKRWQVRRMGCPRLVWGNFTYAATQRSPGLFTGHVRRLSEAVEFSDGLGGPSYRASWPRSLKHTYMHRLTAVVQRMDSRLVPPRSPDQHSGLPSTMFDKVRPWLRRGFAHRNTRSGSVAQYELPLSRSGPPPAREERPAMCQSIARFPQGSTEQAGAPPCWHGRIPPPLGPTTLSSSS
jgi:hypothetical protein